MSTFKNDFENFELDRIDTAVNDLRENNEKYIAKNDQYTILVGKLFENLSEEKVIIFDQIIDLLGDIYGDECLAVYRLAFKDALNFNDKKYFHKEVEE